MNTNSHKLNSVQDRAPSFPIEVFPKDLANFIEANYRISQYDKSFQAITLLTALSSLMSNDYHLKTEAYENPTKANIYAIGIGNSGIGRTAIINIYTSPIERLSDDEERRYKKALAEYETTKKEAKKKGYGNVGIAPKKKGYITQSTTIGALANMLDKSSNNRVTVMIYDMCAWFENMRRYTKDKDVRFWRSGWDGFDIDILRLSRKSIYIENPYISLFGRMQYGYLPSIYAGINSNNGFFSRFLLSMAQPSERIDQRERMLKAQKYKSFIGYDLARLYKVIDKGELSNKKIEIDPFSEEYGVMLDKMTELSNKQYDLKDSAKGQIYGKMGHYYYKFVLILATLYAAMEELERQKNPEIRKEKRLQEEIKSQQTFNNIFNINDEIDEAEIKTLSDQLDSVSPFTQIKITMDIVEKANKLVDYFVTTAELAFEACQNTLVSDDRTTINTVSNDKTNWVKIFNGEKELTTSELVTRIVKENGCSVRTAKNRITASLTKVKHGVYKL